MSMAAICEDLLGAQYRLQVMAGHRRLIAADPEKFPASLSVDLDRAVAMNEMAQKLCFYRLRTAGDAANDGAAFSPAKA